jgi:hypothetical protein
MVAYRSRTGKYTVPAVITATQDSLDPGGVQAYIDSGGVRGVPPLTGPDHVHLTVFTPGLPGQRAKASDFKGERADAPISENNGGSYQEWDVPLDGSEGHPVSKVGEQSPGTWAWPERV